MYANASTPETMGLIILKNQVKEAGHAFNDKGRADFINEWIEHMETGISIEEAIDFIADILVCSNTMTIKKSTMSSIDSDEQSRMIVSITDKLEQSIHLLKVN